MPAFVRGHSILLASLAAQNPAACVDRKGREDDVKVDVDTTLTSAVDSAGVVDRPWSPGLVDVRWVGYGGSNADVVDWTGGTETKHHGLQVRTRHVVQSLHSS